MEDSEQTRVLIKQRINFVCDVLRKQSNSDYTTECKTKFSHLWAQTPISDIIKPFKGSIASLIDHTVLKPETKLNQVHTLCSEAKKYNFPAVCVNPCFAGDAVQFLKESKATNISVAAVCGFPLGANLTKTKAEEAQLLVDLGVKEIDMVINIGALVDQDYLLVLNDIKHVVAASKNNVVKVIIECCLLNSLQIIDASILTVLGGAHYVKTSTGFSTGGAKVNDVRLMKLVVGKSALVKASGGIRDYASAKLMADNGASRIGTSGGIIIVKEENENKGKKTKITSPL